MFRRREDGDSVSIDEHAITRLRVDGTEESVRWADLREVSIITTDTRPGQENLYFVLIGADVLLERLKKLPGFDDASADKALASAGNARFVLWKRS